MTYQRNRIHDHVVAYPGTHFNEITRSLDLAPGQVQYHLRKLTNQGRVVEERLHGQTHYYPPAFDDWERGALALLRRETARDVLFYLLESGPSDPATTADAVGIARSTLEWHLGNLTDKNVVEKRRDSHNRVTLVLVRPVETAALIDEITPSLPERMVDRFTRLVDDVLLE